MRNEKLIEARIQRGWTQEVAAEKVRVSRVAYARWEEQGIIPRLWAINQAREAFNMTPEQLGFRRYSSGVSESGKVTPVSLASLPNTSDNAHAASDLVKLGVVALALARQAYGYTAEELLLSAEQEFRRLDTMTQQHPDHRGTRREALEFLISLPLALIGFGSSVENVSSPFFTEEILPSYMTAVPACWKLYFDGGIADVERVLPNYITQLSNFAQQSTRFQKLAASAASQAYQLSWLLALQHQEFGTALSAIKQAFSYGDIADSDHLRLASLVRQAHVFFHLKRPVQQLQIHEKALQYSSHVSPLLQGWLYIVLAESQAHVGLEEEARRSLSLARDCFPEHPEDDPHFSYVPVDQFFFANHEVLTLLHLNQAKQALEKLALVDKTIPKAIVPRRVELQCRQASAALKSGEMEQACEYVEVAGTSALQLGSDLRQNEASETYQQMRLKWPHERKVKALQELFQP